MEHKLTGIGWICFGILLVLLGLGGVWNIPLLVYIPSEIWKLLGLACGVFGLAAASHRES